MKRLFKLIGIAVLLFVALFVVMAIVSDGESAEPSGKPSQTQTIPQEKTESADSKDTRNRIWSFLENKGYHVKTDFGVPRISKTDAELDEGYEGWIATIEKDNKTIDYSVVLFNGEVSAIRPIK